MSDIKTYNKKKVSREKFDRERKEKNRHILNKISRSPKQRQVEQKILSLLRGFPKRVAKRLFEDDVIQSLQEYANSVSITRMGMNDHGPVHMRIAMLNSIAIFKLLDEAGIYSSLVKENFGTSEDSLVAVIIAAFLHDLGMSIGRDKHELMSGILVQEHLQRILPEFYPDMKSQVIMRSIITEGIVGHMAHQKISSIEAGIVLVSDGCDMIGGRARIPMKLASRKAHVGDIHRYSASSITDVQITKGVDKPVRIIIEMSESAGFFQIENVLMPKIMMSPIKECIELFAICSRFEPLQYL
jgi:metal-dependent HD superfamily phosphatase/phosphodiesterase